MTWIVEFTNKAEKQVKRLNKRVFAALRLLVKDLKENGPAPGEGWQHYGKLYSKKNEDIRHCHLIKGKPTYVCCWVTIDKTVKLIEIYYVGTHEKAPY